MLESKSSNTETESVNVSTNILHLWFQQDSLIRTSFFSPIMTQKPPFRRRFADRRRSLWTLEFLWLWAKKQPHCSSRDRLYRPSAASFCTSSWCKCGQKTLVRDSFSVSFNARRPADGQRPRPSAFQLQTSCFQFHSFWLEIRSS